MSDIKALIGDVVAAVRKVAPQSASNLMGPAAPGDVDALLGAIPTAPKELLALLQLHNGEGSTSWLSLFPNGMQLMDTAHIIELQGAKKHGQNDLTEEIDSLVTDGIMKRPSGPVRPIFFSEKRVPFATLNGDIIWSIDLDPAPGGNVGQIIEEDAECMDLAVIAPSLDALMNDYLMDLHENRFEVNDQGQLCTPSHRWPRD